MFDCTVSQIRFTMGSFLTTVGEYPCNCPSCDLAYFLHLYHSRNTSSTYIIVERIARFRNLTGGSGVPGWLRLYRL